MHLQDRVPTASERIYRKLLDAATEEEYADLEGQLVAICITACRHEKLSPPYEIRSNSVRDYQAGGPFSLPSWVRNWVGEHLSGDEPLDDSARYLGRRCVNALIDEIRWHKRRKRGAQIRNRKRRGDDDAVELEQQRIEVWRVLTEIGLPGKLPIAGDRELFERLVAGYPKRLTNIAVARALGVTEGAIRKRRKRISQVCFGIADGSYQLATVFKQLGLK